MIEINKVVNYVFIVAICSLILYLREFIPPEQSNYPITLSPAEVSLGNQTILYACKGFPQKINENKCICNVLIYVNYTKGECKEVTLTCHIGNISKEVTVDPCINNGSLMKWESIDIPCKLEKECENMKCSFAFKGEIEIKK